MDEQVPTPEKSVKINSSRRLFSKIAGLLTARAFIPLQTTEMAGAFSKPLSEKASVNLEPLARELFHPALLKKGFTFLAKLLGVRASESYQNTVSEPLTTNPDYVNSTDMIRTAIQKYESRGGKAFYAPTPIAQSFDRKKFISDVFESFEEFTMDDLKKLLEGEIEQKESYSEARRKLLARLEITYPGMSEMVMQYGKTYNGYDELSADKHPSGLTLRAQERTDKTFSESISKEIKLLMVMIAYAETPWSTADVLVYFLEKNAGNIVLALDDAHIFLKLTSRNKVATGELWPDISDSTVNKMWRNVQDDCSILGTQFGFPVADKHGLGWNHENPDLRVINQIGTPYHRLGMLAATSHIPHELVSVLGAGNTLFEIGEQQGNIKVINDLWVASELADVVQLLQTLPRSSAEES